MATSDMETRFHTFALTVEGAEAIDNLSLDTREGQRADYLWRSRSVIVELKVLRGDPQVKVDSTFEELSKRRLPGGLRPGSRTQGASAPARWG